MLIMYQKKFAVTHVEGNCEKILALFDDKSAALEYGKNLYKPNIKGILACIQANFDETGNIQGNVCRVFEVWE